MRRLIKFGVAFGLTCAVLFLGGASLFNRMPIPRAGVTATWHRTSTILGDMIIDSVDRFDTSQIFTIQFNADTVRFDLYLQGGNVTGTDETLWVYAQGLDEWGTVLDSSLLAKDTLTTQNQKTVYNTAKCRFWPYMRLVAIFDTDTTGKGFTPDTLWCQVSRMGLRP
jgi:hypothetical protein